ncbi:hypothetical protein ACFC26_43570 [Kitasatospora purpeofusca]
MEPVHHHRAGADATVEVGAAALTDRMVHHAEALAFTGAPGGPADDVGSW